MPKIRGIKPELWTDENFVELSAFARLLWIGLWNHACDNGHLQDKSKQIKMRVLPTDDVNCADLLREIENQELIERADGWITIPNLSHHQKPHKRWWATCDKPGCVLPEGASHAPSNRGATVAPPKRNRVATADCEVDGESDGDVEGEGDKDSRASRSSATAVASAPDPMLRFDEFWDTYAKKVDRKRAEQKWRLALKKPGITDDQLIRSAAAYIAYEQQRENGRYVMDPARWLHGERWRDERKDVQAPLTRTQEHLALVRQLGDQQTLPQIGERR